jgi:putative transposase
MSTNYPSSLTDAEWVCVQRYLPPEVKRGRPRIHSLRDILDAIFYTLRTGCPLRYLPANFPPWQTVLYHFRCFHLKGVWFRLYCTVHAAERERVGREVDPSAAIMDNQCVKTVEESAYISGYDGGKQVTGRKRHLLVDTLGLPIAVYVTPADLSDPAGARKLLAGLAFRVPRLQKIWADAAYRGKDLAEWRQQQGNGWELEIVEREPGTRGFQVQPHRWVVERTQPQYLQSALDAQVPPSHDRAHWVAQPARRGHPPAGSSAGLCACSTGSWCAMSIVTSRSEPRASAPHRLRRRQRTVAGTSCRRPIGTDSSICSVDSSNGS